MKGRVFALGVVLALLAVFLTRGAGPGPPKPPEPAAGRSASPAPPTAQHSPEVSASGRDPFRYADRATPLAAAPRVAPRRLPAAAPSTGVRLVGFVRRGGRLKAALAVGGEVVVAGVGEEAAGYTVLAVDEETGVRLRDAGGVEIPLPPP